LLDRLPRPVWLRPLLIGAVALTAVVADPRSRGDTRLAPGDAQSLHAVHA
jgi:hypothetical protein